MIFIPILAKELSANDLQIGLIGASYGFAVFLSSYIFGRATDIYGKRIFLFLGLFLSGIAFSLQIFANTPLTLGLIRALVGFCTGMYPAALIVYVYEVDRKLGGIASFGSLGWGVGNIIAAILGTGFYILSFFPLNNVYNEVFILSSLFFFISFLIALSLEKIKDVKIYVPTFPIEVIKKNFPIYLAFFIRHTGANSVWIIFPLYMVALGGDKFWLGIFYSVNAISQFVIMNYIDRYKSIPLVYVGLLFAMMTFITFILAPNFWFLLPGQLLIAIAWSCLYVGSLKFVVERNIEKSTSTGLLNSITSLSAVFGPLIGGSIADRVGIIYGDIVGYKATIVFACLLSFFAIILFWYALKNNKYYHISTKSV